MAISKYSRESIGLRDNESRLATDFKNACFVLSFCFGLTCPANGKEIHVLGETIKISPVWRPRHICLIYDCIFRRILFTLSVLLSIGMKLHYSVPLEKWETNLRIREFLAHLSRRPKVSYCDHSPSVVVVRLSVPPSVHNL